MFPGVSVVSNKHHAGGGTSTPASASELIVEDEALIRTMIIQMLEELGHRVVAEAGTLTEGLSLAETAEFLDINVGGYNSESIAQIADPSNAQHETFPVRVSGSRARRGVR